MRKKKEVDFGRCLGECPRFADHPLLRRLRVGVARSRRSSGQGSSRNSRFTSSGLGLLQFFTSQDDRVFQWLCGRHDTVRKRTSLADSFSNMTIWNLGKQSQPNDIWYSSIFENYVCWGRNASTQFEGRQVDIVDRTNNPPSLRSRDFLEREREINVHLSLRLFGFLHSIAKHKKPTQTHTQIHTWITGEGDGRGAERTSQDIEDRFHHGQPHPVLHGRCGWGHSGEIFFLTFSRRKHLQFYSFCVFLWFSDQRFWNTSRSAFFRFTAERAEETWVVTVRGARSSGDSYHHWVL